MTGTVSLTVKGFMMGDTGRVNLWVHFVHHHVGDKIVILKEGNRPHPRFPNCDMFVPCMALKRRHSTNAL